MTEREPHYADTGAEARAPIPRVPIHVVLDNIRSAYNVGSCFRTSDAAAVERLHLCGMSAHPPHRKIDKTALGAQDYVPWTYYERTGDALDALGQQGITIVGVEVVEPATPLFAFTWPTPVAVVFGNEVTGINEKTLAHCHQVVRIPMHGYKNSINIATAFGIILYDILRQWGMSPSGGGSNETKARDSDPAP
jgi:23S rRNA (guanosine2251-2'-O)-methyltransferase